MKLKRFTGESRSFRRITCSAILPVCFLWLCACAAARTGQQHQDLLQAQLLTTRYGIYETSLSRAYLTYLQGRLIRALEEHKGKGNPGTAFNLNILDTDEPIAVSPGPGLMFISRGLIVRLQNEVELAFVMSHEMAHQSLEHFSDEDHSQHSASRRELDADRFALGLVALAGYDIRLVPGALFHAYAERSSQGQPAHPSLESRIKALQTAIRDSAWAPPGSQDRRIFREFRSELFNQ